MIYRYLNLNNNGKLSIKITYKDEEVVFVVKSLLDKTKKYNLDSIHQFELIESFLDFKGESFKDEIFGYYKLLYESANEVLDDPKIKFKIIINKVLDMFDVVEIKNFILSLDYIKAPINLKEKFDENIVKDGIGTRIQTYTKDEYINLIALTVISKAIIAPFGEFLFTNQSTIIMQTKELSLIQMILSKDHIFKSEPVVKLVGSFSKAISSNTKSLDNRTILLKKMISIDDLKWYLLGITFFKIIPVNMPRYDKTTINLITFIYSYTNDSLKPDKTIRQKTARSDGEETESTLEIYRMATDIMVAYPEEFKLFCSKPHDLLKFFNITDDNNVMNDALKFTLPIRKSNNIDIDLIKLMIWVISITPEGGDDIGIIDPEAIMHLELDSLVNMIALAFTICWIHGFEEIALLLVSIKISDEDNMINSTLGKEKITKETMEELDILYPINKEVITKGVVMSTIHLISTSINDFVVGLYSHNYKTLAYSRYTKGRTSAVTIPEDMREQIAKLLISLHKGIK